jgi:hypothetical protein
VRKMTGLFALFGGGMLCLAAFGQTKPTPKPNTPKVAPAPGNAKAAPTSLQLAYALNAGDTFRYRVTGLFNGHFPPFAQPGSPAVNLKVVLEYAGKVNKVDDKGAEVVFVVDKGDLYLLEKEPGEDGKTNPADETPFRFRCRRCKNRLMRPPSFVPMAVLRVSTTAMRLPCRSISASIFVNYFC